MVSIQELAKNLLGAAGSGIGMRCVNNAVLRSFYLESLFQAGQDRSELSMLSDDGLKKLWNEVVAGDFDPYPPPYSFGKCYFFFTFGILDYGAVKFLATQTNFQGLNSNGEVVFQPDVDELTISSVHIDFVSPMYFIGLADEVIRPYICEFHWNRLSATIAFDLNQKQIEEFREIVEEMRK